MQEVAAIVGAISGIVSFLMLLYFVVSWKAGVDADRRAWRDSCDHYPPGELWMMCKTMYDIYVVDTLRQRPDLAESHSPWQLKPKAKELIPADIRKELDNIPQNHVCREDVSNGWLVVKYIGLSHIGDLAQKKGISLQETIAVLSIYLEEKQNHC